MAVIRKVKDNSIRLMLSDHELFSEFLRDFVNIDLLKDVGPEDIKDITENFLTLILDEKESDIIKRVNLKGDKPFFVISIVEHESEVNYRASFRLLQYITLVLDDYEKEINGKHKGIIYTKDFKYPPVLPIVFYDGVGEWTAETNFLNKTEMSGVFAKYIPKFEYELVSLRKYSIEELVKFGDALSLIMIIDKIKTPDGINILGRLPSKYLEKLSLNMPEHLKKLISDIVTALLSKINVPREEIIGIVDRIKERGVSEMFAIENYDVQETRRVAREEGKLEGKLEGKAEGKLEGMIEGRAEGKIEGMIEGKLEGKLEGKAEGKLEATLKMISKMKVPVSEAMRVLEWQDCEQGRIIEELKKRNIPYVL